MSRQEERLGSQIGYSQAKKKKKNYCGLGQSDSNRDNKKLLDSGYILKIELKHSVFED